MTEQEQRDRFTPALDAFTRDVYEAGFHELIARYVDPLDGGERAICIFTDGTYRVVEAEHAMQSPECLVLSAPDLGDTAYCLNNVLAQAHDALVAPVVEIEGATVNGQ